MSLSLIILQLAVTPISPALPDIELNARVHVLEVTIKQDGQATLQVSATPGEPQPVEVRRSAPKGSQRYRNLTINLRAKAQIADPSLNKGITDEGTPP
jgi:hypothetical protein